MATLRGLYEEAKRGTDLVITAPHTRWLQMTQDEQVYSEEAIAFVNDALNKKFKHPRPGRFSPSAMGECDRRVVFGFAGAPQSPPALDNQEMMDHGSWAHLKWQAEGLTMGYMKAAEVWVYDPDFRAGGSMDGTLHDGSNFELKTAGTHVYSKVVAQDRYPKYENLLQDATYKLLADIDHSSVVYEDRSSGQFHEFRIPRSIKLEREVISRLNYYNSVADNDELPPMLEMCTAQTGTIFRRCPYREICALSSSVSQFGKVGGTDAPEEHP